MTDRVVLVTGGTRGVGRGISDLFLTAGAQVVLCGRNEPEGLPDGMTFVACDVREPEQVDAMVTAITDGHGRLDVVVNNAGGSPAADAATASVRFSASVIGLNLMGPLNVSQRANAVMQGQAEGGAIVNIGSVSALRPSPGTAAYAAAKGGLLSLTTTLAVEWAPKVRVNIVTGGIIATEQSELFYGDEYRQAAIAKTIPAGRFGTPTDIANACLFLASPLASYITGANLVVHGGGEPPRYLDA
ncbi:MAG: SDR family oxidoreductase [Actinobacteria bacterium]|nr:SDR family oxidoreductase [Actinomycetota bacterium]